MAKWLEKEVVSPIDGIPPIEEWQSARCSACGRYHTIPYMYFFREDNYCPHCGSPMGTDRKVEKRLTLMDAFQICMKEHPIIADWLNEIRKQNDEPQERSE